MTETSLSKTSACPLIIQGARVLLPSGEIARREVAIADGKITAVGTELEVTTSTQTIDGEGLMLLPGVIDSPARFCTSQPAHQGNHLLTASCACIRGGVTSVIGMPNTAPITTQPVLSKEAKSASPFPENMSAPQSLVSYGCLIDANTTDLAALETSETLKRACGIYLSIGTDSSSLSVDETDKIERIFAAGDRLIALQIDRHDGDRALSALKLALKLSRKYKRRLHILNVSMQAEVALLQANKPSWISAEVTPMHLLWNAKSYGHHSTSQTGKQLMPEKIAPVEPPLQTESDRKQLWQALLGGTINCIATRYSSGLSGTDLFGAEMSGAEMSGADLSGPGSLDVSGVETSLPLLLTQATENHCTLAQVANWMSTAVARIYNIPKKGLIEPGYDADLVLVDLSTYRPVRREERQLTDGWHPFEDWTLTGWPVVTIVSGQIAYDRGDIDTSIRGSALQFDAN